MSTFEEEFDQRCAEIEKRMKICKVIGGFQVIESPAEDGAFIKAWPPIFQTMRAAELFLEEFLGIYALCDPDSVYGASPTAESYEETARVWGDLARQGVANPREVARTFCALQPLHWFQPFH